MAAPRLMLLMLLFSSRAGAQSARCTATGDLEIVQFQSAVFPAQRSLRILLPPGYRLPANRNRRYPALYLNDGQNLFDVCTSMFQAEEWRVDETVDELIASNGLPPLIVIGIDNGGRRLRPREYLPYVDETLNPPEPDPQGQLYPRFLLDEVVPFVERQYRVSRGAQNRVLGGSSYGAGIALFTVIARPGSFGGLLLESPSVYADDYHLLKDAESVHQWPQRVFIGTGTVNEPIEDVQRLKALLKKAGLRDERLRLVIQDGAAHSERWWAQRLPDALKFLFPGPRAPAAKYPTMATASNTNAACCCGPQPRAIGNCSRSHRSLQYGDCFDLDQQVCASQRCHGDQRVCRRMARVEILRSNLPYGGSLASVRNYRRRLHEIRKGGADVRKRASKIGKDLLGLRPKIAWTNQPPYELDADDGGRHRVMSYQLGGREHTWVYPIEGRRTEEMNLTVTRPTVPGPVD